ncbi:MAG: NADH-quinone oxidoreductase subunit N [Candidatus Bipolaricaulia bacterium]
MNPSDLIGVSPEIIMFLTAGVLLFLPERSHRLQPVAGAGITLALISLSWLPSDERLFSGMVTLDPFALVFKALFLGVTLLIVLGSGNYLSGHRNQSQSEYYALILLATTGMMVVASAADLIALFIGFELSSLSTYVLAGYLKKNATSTEAATKFFIIGALSSAIALYGISLIYGVSGTTAIADMTAGLEGDAESFGLIFNVGLALLIVGFGFKITVVPFHMWAPDVYEGSPTPVSALLTAGSKTMGFAALFKIFLVGLLAVKLEWIYPIAVLSVLTMTVGNLIALQQLNIKRMLAYSSIAQAGYILIAFPVGTEYALTGGIFHAITHAFMIAGAFLIVATLSIAGVGERLDDYKGLSQRAPAMAFAMAILMLSLTGIPLFAGFASKFVLFSSAVDAAVNGTGWLIWLAGFAFLNSTISLYYFARVIKYMYVDPAEQTERLSIARGPGIAILIALLFVVFVGLYPDLFINLSARAAAAILPP